MGFPGGSDGKEPACNAGDLGSICGSGRSPEEGMATHSGILAWRIPQTEKPGVLQSMGLQRVGHDLAYGTTTYPTTIKKILYGWRSWNKGGQRVEQGSLRGFRDKARRILSRLQFQALLLISQVTSCLPSCLPNSQTVTGSLYKTGEHCG